VTRVSFVFFVVILWVFLAGCFCGLFFGHCFGFFFGCFGLALVSTMYTSCVLMGALRFFFSIKLNYL
jgi:hypothetical protein